ncbi:hypothetical protein E5163_12075 [Marinicauda algicola]|uniref:DUF6456 domain-containing protein n=1 Tax=Marinicauda algicola TaxID=2029849 RepID=A0A4S2GZM4_9PROT|nr:DUF6456 domain-containing protein [Marinicauda algicola]TGY88543.1 hypothetical protein E5163_12075 [Marinicauda algicola]
MSAPSWMVRLAKPGRVLAPLPGGRTGYGVYAGSDRRRRPFAVASAKETAAALSAGAIAAAGKDCFVLTGAGRMALHRADAPGEAQDRFAHQHCDLGPRDVIDRQGRIETVIANLSESPPARYARACHGRPPLLEPDQVMAGERLRADFHRSAMGAPAMSDWTRAPRGRTPAFRFDPGDAPVARLDAKRRVMDALAAVGPGFDRLLVNVCLRESGMSAAERDLGWPARAGAPALKLALERLAIHYGMRRAPKVADPFAG